MASSVVSRPSSLDARDAVLHRRARRDDETRRRVIADVVAFAVAFAIARVAIVLERASPAESVARSRSRRGRGVVDHDGS
jgi:uncharacterized membrane protein